MLPRSNLVQWCRFLTCKIMRTVLYCGVGFDKAIQKHDTCLQKFPSLRTSITLKKSTVFCMNHHVCYSWPLLNKWFEKNRCWIIHKWENQSACIHTHIYLIDKLNQWLFDLAFWVCVACAYWCIFISWGDLIIPTANVMWLFYSLFIWASSPVTSSIIWNFEYRCICLEAL